jgi:sulfate permease, SulP family
MLEHSQYLEYAGIWLITIVMTMRGMTAALIAGSISALSTYAVQSINYQNPIRQILTASSLRSSAWTRCASARAILENGKTGRARVLIFQLHGHVRHWLADRCSAYFRSHLTLLLNSLSSFSAM